MNNENNKLDLEQLLAEVEHAGRDARRRQELGDMIDRMAAAESRKRGKALRLWTARVAAAACVVFFIVTAVRIWFIPTDGGTMVAENLAVAPSPVAVPPAAEEETAVAAPVSRTAPSPKRHVVHGPERAVTAGLVEEDPVLNPVVDVEDYVAEEVMLEEMAPVPDTILPDTVAPVEIEVPAPLAEAEPHAAAPSPAAEPRRSPFASLFHRAAPSRMDGTVLAFNIL